MRIIRAAWRNRPNWVRLKENSTFLGIIFLMNSRKEKNYSSSYCGDVLALCYNQKNILAYKISYIYEDIRIVQDVIIISFFDQNIVLSLKLKIHQVVSVQCAVLYYSGLYMHICVPDTTFVMTETT